MKLNGLSVETATYIMTFYPYWIKCMALEDETNNYNIVLNDKVNVYIHNKSINLEFGGRDLTLEPNCYTSFICE